MVNDYIVSKGRLLYLEPNNIPKEHVGINTATDSDMKSNATNVTWDPSEFTYNVDLQVIIPSLSDKMQATNTAFDVVIKNAANAPYISFLNGSNLGDNDKKQDYLTTSYTDIPFTQATYSEIKGNSRGPKEQLGIDSINIDFNAQFFPMVTMKFTDVRAASLMAPAENEYEAAIKDGEKIQNNFFKALFHFPYPRFLLTIKGYYGNSVTFILAVNDFKSTLEESGNFTIDISFIGYMYGVYADIPMRLLMVAPYIGFPEDSNELLTTNEYWNQKLNTEFRYINDGADGGPMLTFLEYLTRYKEVVLGSFNGEMYSDPLISPQDEREYANTEKLLRILSEHESTFEKLIKSAEENNKEIYKRRQATGERGDELVEFYASEDVPQEKSVIYLNPQDYVRFEKEVEEYNNTVSRYTDLKLLWPPSLIIGGDFKREIENDEVVKAYYRNISKYPTTEGGEQEYHFFFCTEKFANNVKACRDDITKKREQTVENISRNADVAFLREFGFKPTIENIFRMIFAHIDTFMHYMSETVKSADNMGRSGRRDIKKILNSSESININTDKVLPPFFGYYTSDGDGKPSKLSYPGMNFRMANFPEVHLVDAICNGVSSVVDSLKEQTETPIEQNYEEFEEIADTESNFRPSTIIDLDLINPYNHYLNTTKTYSAPDSLSYLISLFYARFIGFSMIRNRVRSSWELEYFAKNEAFNFFKAVEGRLHPSILEEIGKIKADSNNYNSPVPAGNVYLLNGIYTALSSIGDDFKQDNVVYELIPGGDGGKIVRVTGYTMAEFDIPIFFENVFKEDSTTRGCDLLPVYCRRGYNRNFFRVKRVSRTKVENFMGSRPENSSFVFEGIYRGGWSGGDFYSSVTSKDICLPSYWVGERINRVYFSDDINEKGIYMTKKKDGEYESRLNQARENESTRQTCFYPFFLKEEGTDLTELIGNNFFDTEEWYNTNKSKEYRCYCLLKRLVESTRKRYFTDLGVGKRILRIPSVIYAYIGAQAYFKENISMKFNGYAPDRAFNDAKDFFLEQVRNPEGFLYKILNLCHVTVRDENGGRVYTGLQEKTYSIDRFLIPKFFERTFRVFVPTDEAQRTIVDFILDYTYVRIIEARVEASGKNAVELTRNDFFTAFNTFFGQIREYFNQPPVEITEEDQTGTVEEVRDRDIFDEEEKISTYYSLSNIYNKWLVSLKESDFKLRSPRESIQVRKDRYESNRYTQQSEFDSFIYIDAYHRDISNKFYVNVGKLYERLNDLCTKTIAMDSCMQFMQGIAEDNKLLFLSLPVYNNFHNVDSLCEMFTPMSIKNSKRGNSSYGNTYTLMYTYEPSKFLDARNVADLEFISDHEDMAATGKKMVPIEFSNTNIPENELSLSIPCFGVTYGMQNQSYFKSISVSMENPKETNYSILNRMQIASQGNGLDTKSVTAVGQDLYSIYSNRTYTCTVKMMGCMNMMPLMYFQLNGMPLFKGAYMIISVKHNISQGDMETEFTGVRVSRHQLSMVDKVFSVQDVADRLAAGIASGAIGGGTRGEVHENPNGSNQNINTIQAKRQAGWNRTEEGPWDKTTGQLKIPPTTPPPSGAVLNVTKANEIITANGYLRTKGEGLCATAVKKIVTGALEGMDASSIWPSGYNGVYCFVPLTMLGFTVVAPSTNDLMSLNTREKMLEWTANHAQVGDVAVMDKPGLGQNGNHYGHVCYYNGQNWISDFKQGNIWVYRANPDWPIYVLRFTGKIIKVENGEVVTIQESFTPTDNEA